MELERLAPLVDAIRSVGMPSEAVLVIDKNELGAAVAKLRPDIVFSTFHRFSSGSLAASSVSRFLEDKGIGWIGSQDTVLDIALSKPLMKEIWRRTGVSTPDWFTISRGQEGALSGIESLECAEFFPYFVKPSSEGNSRGIDERSVARNRIELFSKACSVAEEFGEAMVEPYLGEDPEPREFTVALIGTLPLGVVSAVEITKESPGPKYVSQCDKDGHRTRMSPVDDHALRSKVESLARRAFYTAGVRDYARCDLLLHGRNLYAMELNGQPMIPDRWFEGCASGKGLDRRQYLLAILYASMSRMASDGQLFANIPAPLRAALPESILSKLG